MRTLLRYTNRIQWSQQCDTAEDGVDFDGMRLPVAVAVLITATDVVETFQVHICVCAASTLAPWFAWKVISSLKFQQRIFTHLDFSKLDRFIVAVIAYKVISLERVNAIH